MCAFWTLSKKILTGTFADFQASGHVETHR